jgi:hypothetical protein
MVYNVIDIDCIIKEIEKPKSIAVDFEDIKIKEKIMKIKKVEDKD